MVISEKMIENEMGYRGSKSSLKRNSSLLMLVKEQRVDDSWHTPLCSLKKPMQRRCLRFTLAGFERNYQNRILSKLIDIERKRLFSSKVVQREKLNSNIHPWWLTGFIDGEGCFSIVVIENKKLKVGWRVQLFFQIGLHKKDRALLEKIKSFLSVGEIYEQRENCTYTVNSLTDLLVIIDFVNQYPLISQKQADFELFKMAFDIIKQSQHLNTEGLLKIISIKASINQGLSEKIKATFTQLLPVTRPKVKNQIMDPHWLAGFTSGEGCFFLLKFIILLTVNWIRKWN